MNTEEELTQAIKNNNDYYINYIEGTADIICREDAVHIFNTFIDNKQELFVAFGNKLKISKDITTDGEDAHIRMQRLRDYYDEVVFMYPGENPFDKIDNFFLADVVDYIYNHFSSSVKKTQIDGSEEGEADDIIDALMYITRHDIVANQQLYRNVRIQINSINDGKELKIPYGTKPMKALRKLLNWIGYPNMKLFEFFRDKISVILTNKSISGTITISIDPVDFISLSNNNSNWSSCMTMPEGSYCTYVTAMMNSPYCFVAYFENKRKDYVVNGIKYPNKTWRVLMFYDIYSNKWICNNKEYPYTSSELLQEVYNLTREVIGDNLNQEFRDPVFNRAYDNIEEIACAWYTGEFDLESDECDDEMIDEEYALEEFYDRIENDDSWCEDFLENYSPTGSVVIETSPYYNDMFNDHGSYMMVSFNKNWPASMVEYADVAGELTCLSCGAEGEHLCRLYSTYYDLRYENNVKICYDCNQYNEENCMIEIPVISSFESVANMKENVRRYFYDNESKELTNKQVVEIIKDNLYKKDDTNVNYLVHKYAPLYKLNKETLKLVDYLNCNDEDEPELNIFSTLRRQYRYWTFKVAFLDENNNYELKKIEDVTPVEVLYMKAKMQGSEKYEGFKERNGELGFRCYDMPFHYINSDGNPDMARISLFAPSSFLDSKNMMEVISDQDKKYEIVQSI